MPRTTSLSGMCVVLAVALAIVVNTAQATASSIVPDTTMPCPGFVASSIRIAFGSTNSKYVHLAEVMAFGLDNTNLLLGAHVEGTSYDHTFSPEFCTDGITNDPNKTCLTAPSTNYPSFRFYFPQNNTCVTSVSVFSPTGVTDSHLDGITGAQVQILDTQNRPFHVRLMESGRTRIQNFSACALNGPLLISTSGGTVGFVHTRTTANHFELFVKAQSHVAMGVFPGATAISSGDDFIRGIFGTNTTHTEASVASNYDPYINPVGNLRYNGYCGWQLKTDHDTFCGPYVQSDTFGEVLSERQCKIKVCGAYATSTLYNQVRASCVTLDLTVAKKKPDCTDEDCMMVQDNSYSVTQDYPMLTFRPKYVGQPVLHSIQCVNKSLQNLVNCDSCIPVGDKRSFQCAVNLNTEVRLEQEYVRLMLNYATQDPCPPNTTDNCIRTMNFSSVVVMQFPVRSVQQLENFTVSADCPPKEVMHLATNERFHVYYHALAHSNLLIEGIYLKPSSTNEVINILDASSSQNYGLVVSHGNLFGKSSNGAEMQPGEKATISFWLKPLTDKQRNGPISVMTTVVQFPLSLTVGLNNRAMFPQSASSKRADGGVATNVTHGRLEVQNTNSEPSSTTGDTTDATGESASTNMAPWIFGSVALVVSGVVLVASLRLVKAKRHHEAHNSNSSAAVAPPVTVAADTGENVKEHSSCCNASSATSSSATDDVISHQIDTMVASPTDVAIELEAEEDTHFPPDDEANTM